MKQFKDDEVRVTKSIAPSLPIIKTVDSYVIQDQEKERSSSSVRIPKKLKLHETKDFGPLLSYKDINIKGSVSKN